MATATIDPATGIPEASGRTYYLVTLPGLAPRKIMADCIDDAIRLFNQRGVTAAHDTNHTRHELQISGPHSEEEKS